MKNTINYSPSSNCDYPEFLLSWLQRPAMWLPTACRVIFRRPNERKDLSTINFAGLALAAVLALAASPAQASSTNILLNPCFAANNTQNANIVPVDWTYFDDPTVPASTHDYWIEANEATANCGTVYWKEWGAGYFNPPTNNVAGIYQEFGSSPGSVYQASGWFYIKTSDDMGSPTFGSYVWIDVSFLDAGGDLLALYSSSDFYGNEGTGTWFQYQVTNQCDVMSPVATGDSYFTNYTVTNTVANLVAPPNTATVRYRFAYLQAGKEGGSCYFDEAALNQFSGLEAPVISSIYPQNMIFFPQSNGFNFNVSSPSGSTINNSGIHLSLNGVDVSGSLAISGSSSNKAVSYQGLLSNMTYNASITVTDVFNLSASASTYFETTWVGIPPILYLWEAEDFDFSSGMFLNSPDLCNAGGDTNCYYGTVGTVNVDESGTGVSDSHLYRPLDEMNINTSGDYFRANLFLADRPDYEINPFNYGEWMNYTRDFTNGTYWVIARLATDVNLSGSLTMSVVNPNTSLTELGTFTITNGLGWTTFENVFLLSTNGTGNRAAVTLNGKTTLQVLSGGNLLPNFFALVVAELDLPILSGMYPDGLHPLEYASNLTFTVTTAGATFPTNSIKVNLDGFDVSSALVFSGPSSNETVVYPDLLPNAIHTAIITATNSLGHGIAVTNQFDTFDPNNVMVEASDFDYSGGQYISSNNWYPNAYFTLPATTNIDIQHTILGCEEWPYRPDGIPQQQGADYPTPEFVDYGGVEYDLACYGPGDWANYTRMYPTGNFYVYMRTAGLGSYSMNLEQVVSGAGTTNQTVRQLGNWNAVGVNDITYSWVPLTDNGLVEPVVVSLNGVETLRVTTTTGDCYPNYFMLVSTSGIRLSAARSGSNVVVSFPSQAGVVYRIFSRGVLGAGSWNFVTSVLGTGGVLPVSIPGASAAEFYTVVAP
jgi:hypothetical protein